MKRLESTSRLTLFSLRLFVEFSGLYCSAIRLRGDCRLQLL